MTAFILTWKEEVWPYAYLRKLVDTFHRDGVAEENWRIFAHKRAKPGHLTFLLKQGDNPRGIFGFGHILDAPTLRPDPTDLGPPRVRARVRLTRLIDPKIEDFLIPLHELEDVLPKWQINAQASGQAPLSPEAEQWLVQRLRIEDTQTDIIPQAYGQTSGPTTGPTPSGWTGVVTRNVTLPAATYALQFGDRSLWKIGHAQDLEGRLDDINKHIPTEVLEACWDFALLQRWKDSAEAYEMEQKVLELLQAHRTVGERVMCSKGELEAAWTSAVIAVQARRRNGPAGGT